MTQRDSAGYPVKECQREEVLKIGRVDERAIGQLVVARYASGGDRGTFVVRAYLSEPSVTFEDGSHWAASLCRFATPEETLLYWQRRAQEAERELVELKALRDE